MEEKDLLNVEVKVQGGQLPNNQNGKGDWFDLYVAEDVSLKKGEYREISFGIAIKIPSNCTAYIVPRSSTFKKYGILQANSIGVIDSSYCGENDIIKFPAFATRDTELKKGDRIAQMTVMPTSNIAFNSVLFLNSSDRGGFGSTGD